MSEHNHSEGGVCPCCKKVQAFKKRLNALIDRSDLDPQDAAYSLILFALAELIGPDGIEGAEREFMALAKRRLAQFDQFGVGETSN